MLHTTGPTGSTGTRPEDRGRYRIAELPAGDWRVTVRRMDGFAPLHTQQITLKAAETTYLSFGGKRE